MKDKFDVIVVGLGAMGSATIYQLAKRNISVLGIDQFSPPHDKGSSHGESRITRLAIGENEKLAPLAIRSHKIWQELEDESNEKLMNLCGGLYISSEKRGADAHVDDFFARTVKTANELGIKHDILDSADLKRRFPQFNIKDDEYGYYEYETGYLKPEKCIAINLELAKARGAHIITNEKVSLDEQDKESNPSVRTKNEKFFCKKLILTAGAWVNEFIESKSLFKVYRQLLFWYDIEANHKLFSIPGFPVFIWESQDTPSFWYGFPSLDSQTIKLSTESFDQDLANPEELNKQVTEDEINFMYDTYINRLLKDVPKNCVRAQACMYTVTPDFQFVIDQHPQNKNMMIVSACSGHGFKHSAAIGEYIASTICGEALSCPIPDFSIDRFS